MKETHDLSIGREAIIGLSSKVVTMGLGFVGFLLFARVLEPAEFGGYLFVLAGGQIASNLSRGAGTAIKKRVSEVNSKPRELLGLGLLVQICYVVLLATGLIITDEWLRQFLEAPRLTISVVAIVLTLGLYTLSRQFYEGLGYPGYSSWIDTAHSVITLGAQVTLLLYTGLGSFALVLGIVFGYSVGSLIALFASRTWPTIPQPETVRNTWEFARWSIPDAFVSDIYGKIDTVILAVIIGFSAVSFYQVPLRLVQPAAFVSGSIATPLMVRTSGRHSRGLAVLEDLKNGMSYTPIIAIPILFGAMAIPKELLRTVFGPNYSGAGLVLIGLAMFQVVQAFSNPLTSVLEGIEEIQIEYRASLTGVLVSIPLALLLGWTYGVVGIVVSTIIAEMVLVVIYQLAIREKFGEFVFPRPIFEQIFSGTVMFVTVHLVEKEFPITGWPRLLIVVGFGAIVYFGVLLAVSSHFRNTVAELVTSSLPKKR